MEPRNSGYLFEERPSYRVTPPAAVDVVQFAALTPQACASTLWVPVDIRHALSVCIRQATPRARMRAHPRTRSAVEACCLALAEGRAMLEDSPYEAGTVCWSKASLLIALPHLAGQDVDVYVAKTSHPWSLVAARTRCMPEGTRHAAFNLFLQDRTLAATLAQYIAQGHLHLDLLD